MFSVLFLIVIFIIEFISKKKIIRIIIEKGVNLVLKLKLNFLALISGEN
jgi:hypothetical protein